MSSGMENVDHAAVRAPATTATIQNTGDKTKTRKLIKTCSKADYEEEAAN